MEQKSPFLEQGIGTGIGNNALETGHSDILNSAFPKIKVWYNSLRNNRRRQIRKGKRKDDI